ncbi:MAG: acylphosphatase [Thaumarchaeota archaeon]|nr:acylphosphatase [Nitrososphaerota archaeon]MCH8995918.1 acylphosphatase [Nitrososphaerota archaeon]
MAKQRVRLFIKGKVQGVFFRQALKVMAKKNNVNGWVRNLDDGKVEAVLEGEDVDVSKLVEWSHAGSAYARVEDIEIKNEKYKDEFTKFEVLY